MFTMLTNIKNSFTSFLAELCDFIRAIFSAEVFAFVATALCFKGVLAIVAAVFGPATTLVVLAIMFFKIDEVNAILWKAYTFFLWTFRGPFYTAA